MKRTLTLGTGYIMQGGMITGKFDLPVGDHHFPDDATVVEVRREELTSVQVIYSPTETEIKEKRINDLITWALKKRYIE
jgi:hypothetical protein